MNPRVAALLDPQGTTVIKVCDFDGEPYLSLFDPEFEGGMGLVDTTYDPKQALRFTNSGNAMELWRMQSHTKPLRADGKPNRPLSALTVSIEKLP